MSQRGSGISSVLVRSLLAPALLVALASAARAQDAAVVGQVYDANGAFVGTVIDFDQNEQAARVHGLIQGSIVEFTVRNLAVEEYLDPKTKRVYFTSGDCTGQAYVRADATFPALAASWRAPEHRRSTTSRRQVPSAGTSLWRATGISRPPFASPRPAPLLPTRSRRSRWATPCRTR